MKTIVKFLKSCGVIFTFHARFVFDGFVLRKIARSPKCNTQYITLCKNIYQTDDDKLHL